MMRTMGNAAEYFMFFKWKTKILVSLCIFYKKNFWVKNNDTILFTNNFDYSLKIDCDYVELSGKTAMISTKPWPPRIYYFF